MGDLNLAVWKLLLLGYFGSALELEPPLSSLSEDSFAMSPLDALNQHTYPKLIVAMNGILK